MKKRLVTVLGLAVIIGCMSACGADNGAASLPSEVTGGEQVSENEVKSEEAKDTKETKETKEQTNEMQTYEFESYDNKTVVIDNLNIISQIEVDSPLEWDGLPADAENCAPGRDIEFFENNENYYILDDANGLVTIAVKRDTNKEPVQDIMEYLDGDIAVYYEEASFVSFDDEENNSITLSYDAEGVEAAGTNTIIFKNVKGADYKEEINKLAKSAGVDSSKISEVQLMATEEKSLVFMTTSESKESGLKIVEAVYSVPYEGGAIIIDIFRTVGPDEGTEMTIDSAFDYVMETFKFMH